MRIKSKNYSLLHPTAFINCGLFFLMTTVALFTSFESHAISVRAAISGDANSGINIAVTGDFNGDGHTDVAVCNSSYGTSNVGAVYIYASEIKSLTRVSSSGSSYSGGSTLSDASIVLTGTFNGEDAGTSCAALDVNGDGITDLLVGAPANSASIHSAGSVYLVMGSTSLASGSLADHTNFSSASQELLGYNVARAGDVNNDGLDDFLIGSNNDPQNIYLILGSNSGYSSTDPATMGIIFTGFVRAGLGLAAAGDVNGDGYDDFLVSDNLDGTVGPYSGASYLVLGNSSLAISGGNISSAIKFTGEAADEYAGDAVSGIGDYNNDGYDDFAIRAANGNYGAVYIVLGNSKFATGGGSLAAAAIKFEGPSSGDNVGYSISPAGDINADGYDDFLIGAEEVSTAGAAYLLLGKSIPSGSTPKRLTLTPSSRTRKFVGLSASDKVGSFVGQGFGGNFIIGASGNDENTTDGGRIWLQTQLPGITLGYTLILP